jgi:hypothetical protein
MRQSTGVIVPFPSERVRRVASTQASGQEGAEILLFIGVRYERQIDADTDAPVKRRGRNGARVSRRQRRA